MNTLEQAQRWHAYGVATIPIKPGSKAPLVKWKKYQTALPTEADLMGWFAYDHGIGAGIAVITGWQGLTVLDFDTVDAFQRWRYWAMAHGERAEWVCSRAYQVSTARGVHVYLRLPQATRTRPLFNPDGSKANIDIKGKGGYVLAPPTLHPSGSIYTAMDERATVPSVEALSDVLPAEMLQLPKSVGQDHIAVPARPSAENPWKVAANAARPTRGLVAKVRNHYRIESFFTDLKPSGGAFFMTRCPLHDDHNPSMWVNTDLQICGCNAGCTPKPLDVINLYARLSDVDNTTAILSLGRDL